MRPSSCMLPPLLPSLKSLYSKLLPLIYRSVRRHPNPPCQCTFIYEKSRATQVITENERELTMSTCFLVFPGATLHNPQQFIFHSYPIKKLFPEMLSQAHPITGQWAHWLACTGLQCLEDPQTHLLGIFP